MRDILGGILALFETQICPVVTDLTQKLLGSDQEALNLHLLPHLVLLQICDTIGVEDVLALAGTNKTLHSFLHSCFLVVLRLPVTLCLQEAAR